MDPLENFAYGTDKETPPVFVGRKEILHMIRIDLHRRIQNWQQGNPRAWEAGTFLIQGAPGAGKTALLSYLHKTLPQYIKTQLKEITCKTCHLHVKELLKEPNCEQQLAEALLPEGGEALSRQVTKTSTTSTQVEAKFIAAAALKRQRTKTTTAPALRWPDVLSRAKDRALHPVLLTIDEVQNTTGTREDQPALFLQWVHEATNNLPILPVYGGLAWSEKHLDALGISRLAANQRVHTLQALSRPECKEAIHIFLENQKYQIQGKEDTKEAWINMIKKECQGWPQHLHIYLIELAKALCKKELSRNLERVDMDQVKEQATKERKNYYAKRMESSHIQDRNELAGLGIEFVHVRQEKKQPLNVMQLGRILDRFAAWAAPLDPTYELPKNMSGEDFVKNGMIKAGIIHKDTTGKLLVPIPSFAAYVRESRQYQPLWEILDQYCKKDRTKSDTEKEPWNVTI